MEFVAFGLDIGVSPLILMSCWNAVMPQTFDYVHPLDYTGAFLIRIAFWAFFWIFSRCKRKSASRERCTTCGS